MGVLEGRVSIITGGANGLGAVTAELFAENGAKVIIADIDEENGMAIAEKINQAGGAAAFVKADVTKPESLENMVQFAVDTFGRLDIAVNSAARIKDKLPIAEMDIEEFDEIIDINLKGVILSIKYELRQMMIQGKGGNIVNISAVSGLRAQTNIPAHMAVKHAIVGLTKSAAMDYSPHGIRVNAVAPGAIGSEKLSAAMEGFNFKSPEYADHLSMMKRFAEPIEVAKAILWLASDASSYVTGTTLPVDGGFTAK
ncbi:MAG: SDR family NAD(P)-dependent oxidoreductase [Dehalobacterium sp.]|jgi:NAD(P)-dependent dehydrogenase (short-subunit alcohol dehydrogenase family)